MKKGAIAVETIAKMIIVMIAIAILVYLLIRYVLGSGLSERECAAKMTAWCAQCQLANRGSEDGWTGGPTMDEELADCAREYWTITDGDCTGNKNDCKAFLPM